jgi:hypothetical protein
MVEVRHSGKSMEQRVADCLKPSGDAAHANHHAVHGSKHVAWRIYANVRMSWKWKLNGWEGRKCEMGLANRKLASGTA